MPARRIHNVRMVQQSLCAASIVVVDFRAWHLCPALALYRVVLVTDSQLSLARLNVRAIMS